MSESFSFGSPATTDANDGTTLYVLGCHWSPSVNGSWTGVQWRVPDSLSGDNHYILGYQDGGSDLGYLQSKGITPTVGTLQTFSFNTPVSVTAGTGYLACVLTNHYTYTAGYTFPHTDGHLTTDGFKFVVTVADGAKIPVTSSALNYHISPVGDFGFSQTLGIATEHASALPIVGRTLKTPTVDEGIEVYTGLWRFYKLTKGISLLVSGSTVTQARYPYQEDLANYDFVYMGGHEYLLSTAEAVTLTNAGYGAFIS